MAAEELFLDLPDRLPKELICRTLPP